MDDQESVAHVEQLLATPGLAHVLESDRFKQFLDHVPVAIAVAELQPSEAITYCNLEFERLTGQSAAAMQGRNWTVLPGVAAARGDETHLGDAVLCDDEYIGTFTIASDGRSVDVDAWSNTIESDDGKPIFRLVALAKIGQRIRGAGEQDEQLLRDKDVLLRELQHRVKNNLQMITALIRMEARNVSDDETGERFDRLAGRINSLALLYDLPSGELADDGVDLGVYLSKIRLGGSDAHDQTSFPSGHSAGAISVAQAFARSYLDHALAARTAAFAVSAAQVPRGTHYVGDVAAGILVGFVAERISHGLLRASRQVTVPDPISNAETGAILHVPGPIARAHR